MMKLNEHDISDIQYFAFDTCHKIYLCESESEIADAKNSGYEIFPIAELPRCYEESCSLRFISNWSLSTQYVSQFEDADFEEFNHAY